MLKGKSMSRRFLVLVIDGLGVGAMEDVEETRPQDRGADTLRHVVTQASGRKFDTLRAIGALDYFFSGRFAPRPLGHHSVSLGKFRLAHFGADSYLGHQELAGTIPPQPVRQFVREVKDAVLETLHAAGFQAEYTRDLILVDEHIAIADNIETDYGLNVNVVGSLDHYPYETIEKVGRCVRDVVQVGRVITMGGVGTTQDDFFRCLERRERDGYVAYGINIPKLRIYDDRYRVIHMGYGVDAAKQAPGIAARSSIPVALIGKTADVIEAPGAEYLPAVLTEHVLQKIQRTLAAKKTGFIFANVQQTDLAGHEQDVGRFAALLEFIDQALPDLVRELGRDDMMIITGDHGNDPAIGHTNHTREKCPLIFFSRNIPAQDFGERSTLADVGATVSRFFNIPLPQDGSPLI